MCAPLAPLLGTWRGVGEGGYPTVDCFSYVEELTFGHVGKPFVVMTQRSRDPVTGEPLHAETGYFRPQPPGAAQPFDSSGFDGAGVDGDGLDGAGVAAADSAPSSRRPASELEPSVELESRAGSAVELESPVELILAQASGIVEIDLGTIRTGRPGQLAPSGQLAPPGQLAPSGQLAPPGQLAPSGQLAPPGQLARPGVSEPELVIDVATRRLEGSPTAKSVTAVRRRISVGGDTAVSDLWMAAVGHPMLHHVRSELRRAG